MGDFLLPMLVFAIVLGGLSILLPRDERFVATALEDPAKLKQIRDLKRATVRPWVRWVAGVLGVCFLGFASVFVRPATFGVDEAPNAQIVIGGLFVGGMLAATAIRGDWFSRLRARQYEARLLRLAAERFLAGKITLDEYARLTRELLQD